MIKARLDLIVIYVICYKRVIVLYVEKGECLALIVCCLFTVNLTLFRRIALCQQILVF